MNVILAILTSKTAILITLGLAIYQSQMSNSTAVLVVVWGLFAGAVIGRGIRQAGEPDKSNERV